jgi:hypothetical protein
MALPTSGQISLQTIKNEFGPNIANIPTNLSDYYRGGLYVRNTGVNASIPTSGQIKYSDFRGGVKYEGVVSIYVIAETTSQYANSNNGYLYVYVYGNSPSCTVTVGGRTSTYVPNPMGANPPVPHWNGVYYDSSASVGVTVTDTSGTYNFGPFSIGYGAATRNYVYTL